MECKFNFTSQLLASLSIASSVKKRVLEDAATLSDQESM